MIDPGRSKFLQKLSNAFSDIDCLFCIFWKRFADIDKGYFFKKKSKEEEEWVNFWLIISFCFRNYYHFIMFLGFLILNCLL